MNNFMIPAGTFFSDTEAAAQKEIKPASVRTRSDNSTSQTLSTFMEI